MELVASNALGIGAASFWSEAEKDIAESPTAIAGTPKERQQSTVNSQQALCTEPESVEGNGK